MKTTRIYLVRHGETVDNVNRILQGQTDGRLNDNGIRMAQEVARRMASVPIDAFISSDLGRCVHTCRIIAQGHGKPVVTTPWLRERDWGSFTGQYIPDVNWDQWPGDVETTDQMRHRAELFLRWVRRDYAGQTLLVVGHGIINKVILSILTGLDMHAIPKMQNAEVRLVELPPLDDEASPAEA